MIDDTESQTETPGDIKGGMSRTDMADATMMIVGDDEIDRRDSLVYCTIHGAL
jgi:hypothetical protein